MSTPTKADMRKLMRLIRHLVGKVRIVLKFKKIQAACGDLDGCSDSDRVGCWRTARSTSGGVILRGSHFIKS